MKRLSFLIFFIVLISLSTAFTEGVANEPVKKISFAEKEVILIKWPSSKAVECTEQDLILVVEPSGAKPDQIIWKSDNLSVASVTQDGRIHSEGLGQTKVSASVTREDGKELIATCTVKVVKGISDINIAGITGCKSGYGKTYISVGKEYTLDAQFIPSNTGNFSVEWSSSNPEVVSVNRNGKIKTLSCGEANIKCTVNERPEFQKTITIIVLPPVKELKQNTQTITAKEYEKIILSDYYSIEPEDALQELEWEENHPYGIYIYPRGNQTILNVMYSYDQYDYSYEQDKTIRLTGRTLDGTNKKITFTLKIEQANANAIVTHKLEATPAPTPKINCEISIVSVKLKSSIIPELYVVLKNGSKATVDRIDFDVKCYDAYGSLIKGYGYYDISSCFYDEKINSKKTSKKNQRWYLDGFDGIKSVEIAITAYHQTNGSTVTIPDDQLKWEKYTFK